MDMWIIVIIILTVLFFIYGYLSNYHLTTTHYDVPFFDEDYEPVFAVLADLHCCRFGKDYKRLIERIDEVKPDAVLIPGDMTIKHLYADDPKVLRVLKLVDELKKKYPLYYANGNHEIRMFDQEKYTEELKRAGVIYLDNTYADFSYKGDNDKHIRIYGLNLSLDHYRKRLNLDKSDLDTYLGKSPDDYCVLLAHDPGFAKIYAEWGADLSVCGHLHGGILRLPFVGGVIAPGFRIFPKYDGGIYNIDQHVIAVSRGLGTHHLKFRFFNPPELVFLHLKSVKKDKINGNTGKTRGV